VSGEEPAGSRPGRNAAILGQPFRIRLTGRMDPQYVADVAESFVRCALAPLEGAYAFNLEGTVTAMDEPIGILDRSRPGACRLITAEGAQVPVAYARMCPELRRPRSKTDSAKHQICSSAYTMPEPLCDTALAVG